jgi:parallel beta-helix repeat protein
MNGLGITLNDRKRFVLSATLAAVFVVLAGGANALATNPYTVWTVSKTSSHGACAYPSPTTCNTIGSAVSAASPGDVILVGPGTYKESVAIYIPLSIFGAQAGKDARGDRHGPESIVDATGLSGAAFLVDPSSTSPGPVTIDGFTIQGGAGGTYGAGIWAYYYAYPLQIVNNIIQNNAVGVYLEYGGATLMEHNLFKTNNNAVGAGSEDYGIAGTFGYGIGTYYPYYSLAITENEFNGNTTTGVYVYYTYYNTTITGNTSENDGSLAICNYYCYGVQFRHNQGKNFGAHGVTPLPGSIYPDAAIDIGYYSFGVQISDNDLEEGKAPINNGIAFTNIFGGTYACCGCSVNNNKVKRFPKNGIVAEDSTGTLYDSTISGNDVEDNGQDGILIEGPASTYNYGNVLFGNKAEGNHVNDCEDDTTGTGSGTPPTANTWFNNIASSSLPTGLCTPGTWH